MTRRQTMLARRGGEQFRRVIEELPREIRFGDQVFQVEQADWEYGAQSQTGLLCRLLDQGWAPGKIGAYDLQYLSLCRWTFQGRYDRIPELDLQAPIRFKLREKFQLHPVELPLELVPGQGGQPICFTDQVTGQVRRMQVLQTRLVDMWEQMEQVLAEHRRRKQIPEQQIDQMQAQFEWEFAQECPAGMVYPAVEYWCEGDLQLDFYLREYLDQPPQNSGHTIGFLAKPEREKTPEGRKIRVAVLPQPVAPETGKLQAELFACHIVSQPEDLLAEAEEEEWEE